MFLHTAMILAIVSVVTFILMLLCIYYLIGLIRVAKNTDNIQRIKHNRYVKKLRKYKTKGSKLKQATDKIQIIHKLRRYIVRLSIEAAVLLVITVSLILLAIQMYSMNNSLVTVSTVIQNLYGKDKDCICYVRCTGDKSDDKKSSYELLFGPTEYDKLIKDMKNELPGRFSSEWDTASKSKNGRIINRFLLQHLTDSMVEDYRSIVGQNPNFRKEDGHDRTTMSTSELKKDLINLLNDYKVNGVNPNCNCKKYSSTKLTHACLGESHYVDGYSWENLWNKDPEENDEKQKSSYTDTPGHAVGDFAFTLDDGKYYWYHQDTKCNPCKYDAKHEVFGKYSSCNTLGGGPMGGRGCSTYSLAIALSNLLHEEYTPWKTIDKLLGFDIDEDNGRVTADTKGCAIDLNTFNAVRVEKGRVAKAINENEYLHKKGIRAKHCNFPSKAELDKILDNPDNYGYVYCSFHSISGVYNSSIPGGSHYMIIRKHDSKGYYLFTSSMSHKGSKAAYNAMTHPVSYEELSRAKTHVDCVVITRAKKYFTVAEETLTGGKVLDFTKGGNFEFPSGWKFCYTYMGWQRIYGVNPTSAQSKLIRKYFPKWISKVNDKNRSSFANEPDAFDSEGFGKIDGRYVVAVTHEKDNGVAKIGDKLDVYLKNGNIIHCIVGDIKATIDSNWTKWGHNHGTKSNPSISTLEFVVNAYDGVAPTWYKPPSSSWHKNPGDPNFHYEWHSPITKIVIGGKKKSNNSLSESEYLKTLNSNERYIRETAYSAVGHPYVWGGTSLYNGCDCSGFIMRIYEGIGINLQHSSYIQGRAGRHVNKSGAKYTADDLKVGDILWHPGHVMLYVGKGEVIHAAGKKWGIVKTTVGRVNIVEARRILH